MKQKLNNSVFGKQMKNQNESLSEPSDYKKYIGVKLVQSIPLSKGEALNEHLIRLPKDENGLTIGVSNSEHSSMYKEYGYKVIYEDGYVSWSPKNVFEKAYRIIDGLTFGLAIESVKLGKKLARMEWNGKDMYIQLQAGRTLGVPLDGDIPGNMFPFIAMKVSGNSKQLGKDCIDLVPWVASQTDILAEDWYVID